MPVGSRAELYWPPPGGAGGFVGAAGGLVGADGGFVGADGAFVVDGGFDGPEPLLPPLSVSPCAPPPGAVVGPGPGPPLRPPPSAPGRSIIRSRPAFSTWRQILPLSIWRIASGTLRSTRIESP